MADGDGLRFIVWKDDFSVGVDELDAQHHAIVEVVNDLNEAVHGGGDRGAVRGALAALWECTHAHFAAEEALLRAAGYPDFEAHKALHDRMLIRTGSACRRLDALGEDPDRGLLNLLKDWWLGHIVVRDRHYCPYLMPAPLTEIPADLAGR